MDPKARIFPPVPGFENGAAYIDGRFMPVGEAAIPIMDSGYRRSDVTYDVVGTADGNFFRLDDHIARFHRSREELRMYPPESDEDLRAILNKLVALTGLANTYVSMECLRAAPPPGKTRHPSNCRSYLVCFASPWVSVATEEMFDRGMHLIISEVERISPKAVDPTVKNFHWGDLTRSLFEVEDKGGDYALLPDADGNITEGAGFNVFMVKGKTVSCPARGALEGVTRKSVFELCAELGLTAEARDITAQEFRDADEIFTCTTAGGIMPASRIDGRIMNNDRPGPISTLLKETFWAKRAEGWHATPVDYSVAEAAA
ncbi:aminotransferase class IV [Chachezhania sediminis]|uniref:aminotransferase class IV n=1 Tax=Chachezhania sediminis TaxID=2599291 RepID=UPI00131AA114|nr:aminotransferase class IV [Chachezhania sediminis]